MKKIFILSLLALVFILTGCSERSSFSKGDIKDDFCGPVMNFQYCKCAFHNDFCDAIGMKRSEAKKYVHEQYDAWVESELERFQDDCRKTGGIVDGKSCYDCPEGEVAQDDVCVESEEEDSPEEEVQEKGECKYDNECDAICEGDVKWKMVCNGRTNKCEKHRDTDCSSETEVFGELEFGQICSDGECVRDGETITATKRMLEAEKAIWSQAVKDINNARADINVAMLDANKNCINGIADMTNLAIVEFATKVGSILAGGIPDIAKMTASASKHASGLLQSHTKSLSSAAVDYAGTAVNKLGAYAKGTPPPEEKKLKPHEYIKLNCDLYNYFIELNTESEADLEIALQYAREVDALLDGLP